MHPDFEHLYKRTHSIECEIMSILKAARRLELDENITRFGENELKRISGIFIDVFERLNDI